MAKKERIGWIFPAKFRNQIENQVTDYMLRGASNIILFVTCLHFYTPRNEVVGGYTGFTMSVRLSVRPSVRPSVDKSYVVR
jgi:hypothetical protein